jgi:hypothetical protein
LSVYIITKVGGSLFATCPTSHHEKKSALLCCDKPLDVLLPGNSNRMPDKCNKGDSTLVFMLFMHCLATNGPVSARHAASNNVTGNRAMSLGT